MLSSKVSFYYAKMQTMFSVRNLVVNWNNNLFYVSWRIKDQLDVSCYFLSLFMCSTCFGYSCASACKTDNTPTQPLRISNTHRTKNITTDVVIQQNNRKLLMKDILMSETRWAHKKWNKIASDIKLVFYSSTVAMMHGQINIRFTILC